MNTPGLIALALIALAFAGLYFMTSGRDSGWIATKGLGELKARRNWRIDVQQETLGKGRRFLLNPVDDSSWSVVMSRYTAPGTLVATTEFFFAPAKPAHGSFVVGPPMSDAEAGLAAGMFGKSAMAATVLAALIGQKDAAAFSTMAYVSAEESGFDAGTVFAGPDAFGAGEAAALAAPLKDWRSKHPEERDFAIILRSPSGLRIRLRNNLASADRLEAFVDFALDVSARLEASAPS